MTTETVEAPTAGYCPTCGQKVEPPCTICGLRTHTTNGIASHISNHKVDPDEDGICTVCGLSSKPRWNGVIGHVFDHRAVIE